jgi:hypothetical protein
MTRKSCAILLGIGLLLGFSALTLIWPTAARSSQMSFKLTLPREKVSLKNENGTLGLLVSEKGYYSLNDEGLPALPVRIINILIPQGEQVRSFAFDSQSSRVIAKNAKMRLAAPAIAEDGTKGKSEALFSFSVDGSTFPSALGRLLGIGYLHGFTVASFALSPVQYKNGVIVLNDELTLSITTDLLDEDKTIAVRQRFDASFNEEINNLISSQVLNSNLVSSYQFDQVKVSKPKGGFHPSSVPSLEGSPVDYLIITSSAMESAYQRLADWKTKKGVPTVVRTIEWIKANEKNGADLPETVRFFIRDAYEKWGVKWVLLGGDTDVIPARYAVSRFYGEITLLPTDIYYACLDGSWNDNHDQYWGEGFYGVPYDNPDLYAEVNLGRLPTSTAADASDLVEKIISYETPYQTDYTNRALMLAEVLFPVGWKPGDSISLNGADFSEYVYGAYMSGKPLDVTRAYETDDLFPGSVHESRQAAIDSMNSGMNLINHIGHGFRFNLSTADASVVNSDADALTNSDRYFLLYMLNCTAAAFDYYCLAEHFLKNPSGGAVAIVGASRSAYPNASSYYMFDFYNQLLNQNIVNVGETFTRSRLSRTPYAEAGDNVDLWTHYIYVLLSDPEIPIWTGPVDTLDVVHVADVGLGKNTILINVTDGGLPVDSAFVCLYKGEDDYQYASTNTLGNATFDFTCENPGSVSVVVTGRNHAMNQSYIVVNQSIGPYVDYSGLTIDDDSLGGTFGNDNGAVDAGETVGFTLSLVNSGGGASDSVWCVLRTSDPRVTVEDSIAAFGSMGASETKQALDRVVVQFSDSLSDEASVLFSLEIHNSSDVWHDSFIKVVHAPKLDLITLRIDDSLGNGNGIVDPGEEFKLHYKIKNYGTGTASGLTAKLEDLDAAFVFFDSLDAYADLDLMESGENLDGFHILETSTAVEHRLQVRITDIFGATYLDTIELRKPYPPSNLVFDASLGDDRIQVTWVHSISADVEKYNLYHSLTQGGPYELRSVDPVDHSVYTDVGLQASTKYYYVATAIDSSGNESDYSTEYSCSTNPPQLEGWPIQMLDETVSSPAVGDIDGDYRPEIVQGDRHVYAWHSDGVELRDGDSDPQTWGVLNSDGLNFVAPVTLADIDTVEGFDIIAVSYSTKQVYVFNYLGNTLPGWPQSTSTNVRAAPVIADLDGDGKNEIIVVDQSGMIYAWHSDGTEYRDGDGNPSTTGVFYDLPPLSGWHYQAPAVCDIDKDDKDELIVGSLLDSVYIFNEDGTQVPGWPVALPSAMAGSIAVGDADLDGEYEILVACKSSEVRLINHDGTTCSGWPRWIGSNITYNSSPAMADITGDGHLEIIMASTDHKLYVIDYQGNNVPGWPVQYSSTTYTESSPIVADINGDGSPDIILGDEAKYINAWDASGNLLDGFPLTLTDAVRATPAVADIDIDGDAELIVAGWDKNVYVWDLDGMFLEQNAPWPTFHANRYRNGQAGFIIPTAITNVAFNYRVLDEAIELSWTFPPASGYVFDLYRKIENADGLSSFVKIQSNVTPDGSGMLRLVDPNLEPGRSYVYRLEAAESNNERLQNYPNPFNPTTTITFYVPEGAAERVSLNIYDVKGSLVKILVSDILTPSKYEYKWDGRNDNGDPVSSGVYFYQLRVRGFKAAKKMVLLK